MRVEIKKKLLPFPSELHTLIIYHWKIFVCNNGKREYLCTWITVTAYGSISGSTVCKYEYLK